MLSSRTVVIFALAMGTLASGASGFTNAAQAEPSSADAPLVTRVFYLQGMEPREAQMLLRRQVQIRKTARIPGRDLIVVADVVDKVNQSESLLRQQDAIHRATDPHDPWSLKRLREGPVATRIFRIDGDEMDNAVAILRVIYDMRQVTELDEENSVSVRDARTILAASEALLRELGLLVDREGAWRFVAEETIDSQGRPTPSGEIVGRL